MGKKLNNRVFIIAEAGVNHNGDINIAKKMIDVAKESGVDAIKFQTFKTENMVTKFAPKADYQKKSTPESESQFQMLKKLELDLNAHKELIGYCREKSIVFLSSPFDLKSIELLNYLGLKIFKIPSGEITNFPYLRKIGKLKKKVILSTGMSNLKEIKQALSTLIKAGTKKKDITILHCNSAYPTPFEDVNLLAMLKMKEIFKINIGYSDHTVGIEIPIAAVALGARILEKHFTLNRAMYGPDQAASLEPEELKDMVSAIRNIERSLGNGRKIISFSESENQIIARKSIVAATAIKKGEFFTKKNIAIKRPGFGISPMRWNSLLGRRALKDFSFDELITL